MKYIWKEIESEEDFIEAFGENPGWVLFLARLSKPMPKLEETLNPDAKDSTGE